MDTENSYIALKDKRLQYLSAEHSISDTVLLQDIFFFTIDEWLSDIYNNILHSDNKIDLCQDYITILKNNPHTTVDPASLIFVLECILEK